MHRIDNPTAVATMPVRKAAGPAGFFTQGNQATGALATIVEADVLNAVMMEIANVVTGAGIALSKTDDAQMLAAIRAMIEAVRLTFMPVEQGGGGIWAGREQSSHGLGDGRIRHEGPGRHF